MQMSGRYFLRAAPAISLLTFRWLSAPWSGRSMVEGNGRRLVREYVWFALVLIVILMGSAAHAAVCI